MPGKQVKNWRKYHSLRRKGYSKNKASRIANKRGNGNRLKARVTK